MTEGFRGPQVCRLTGVTYRQLDYWDRIGLVCPSLAEAAGSGSCRVYSYEDLVVLVLVRRLMGVGRYLKVAQSENGRDLVDALRLRPELIGEGKRFTLVDDGPLRVTIDIRMARAEVDAAIATEHARRAS